MTNIWNVCEGHKHVKPFNLDALRIVESQEQVATMSLVDNYEEQHLLEQLLDDSKPPQSSEGHKYHYLIATPFRYPPLRHGSRFGLSSQRGMFYGSLKLSTVFAECAYYRFVFWSGMATPPQNRINSQHTTFSVTVSTKKGIRLEQVPFRKYTADISNPVSYQQSQALGQDMREQHVEAFTFVSARDKNSGINLGVFDLSAITSTQPNDMQHWSCILTAEAVTFLSTYNRDMVFNFNMEDFFIDKKFPQPACF